MQNYLASAPHTHLFVTNNNALAQSSLTAQNLSELPSLPFLMQALPPHTLYLVLRSSDLLENTELVEWIRGTQMQKILDFDIWEHNPSLETSDISENAAMSWIQSWLALGKSFAAERFFELEEETALLILSKLFTILPEGIAHVTDDIRENWVITPDKRFFIEPTSHDGTNFEILTEFVDALYGADIRRAGLLFSSASLLVRQETLDLAQKWRNARLADQGFIQRDEAYASLFSAKNLPTPLSKFKHVPEQNYFAVDASENIEQLLTSLPPDDAVHLIKLALGKEGIKQITGSKETSIENLYDDTGFVDDFIHQIVKNSAQILSQHEHAQTKSQTSGLLIEKVLHAFQENNEEKYLLLKQKMARISNTVASALSEHNSYRSNIINTSLLMVRGALNVGLELCLEHNNVTQHDVIPPHSDVIPRHSDVIPRHSDVIPRHSDVIPRHSDVIPRLDRGNQADPIQNAIHSIEHLGLDYVFKLGFNAIIDLQQNLLHFLYENKFISTKKRTSAQQWLNANEAVYSTETILAIEGLLNLIPVCHVELFVQNQNQKDIPASDAVYLSQKFKPFEHHSEVLFVQKFIQNIHLNLH